MGPKVKLKSWIAELRAPFLTGSILPVLLGSSIAWARNGMAHWGYFALSLAAGVSIHLGANIANDYFDHKSGNDEINKDYIRPFSGGSRMIQRGLLRPSEVLLGSLVFFALGVSIGLYLAWVTGVVVLVLGVIGVFSAVFYTCPPFYLAKRGIGELFVGLSFGVLMVLGAYYVQTQAVSWEATAAGVPLSTLIAAVLYVNEFPDYEADGAVGKRTLVVRLGKDRAVIGYGALMAATYLLILAGVAVGLTSPLTLLGLLTAPAALKAYRCARLHFSDSKQLVPANALTITVHMATGLLLCLAYVLQGIIFHGVII